MKGIISRMQCRINKLQSDNNNIKEETSSMYLRNRLRIIELKYKDYDIVKNEKDFFRETYLIYNKDDSNHNNLLYSSHYLKDIEYYLEELDKK